MGKKRRQLSVNQMRLVLLTVCAVQFPNLLCMFLTQLSAVLAEGPDEVMSFHDVDFTNITAVDIMSRKAMKRLHDDLDQNDDGNVSLSEGAKYLHNGEFTGHASDNLPGFETDKDGRITEAEFWENWVRSEVHNWTVAQMVEWICNDVDLPQYASKFKQYGISGAAMPILANNGSIVLSLVDGVKEHRIKLWLKALDVVVCGYTRSKSSLLKDILVTVSLALALGGIVFGFRVRRNASVALSAMQEKLNNLQTELRTLDEDPVDGMWMKDISPTEETARLDRQMEHSGSNSSLSSDASLQTRLAETQEELSETKLLLGHAEERLKMNEKKWSPPSRLIACLKTTHQVEIKLHEMKRQQVQKKVEQATMQFQKMKKKLSLFSTVHFIHSRQVESFDLDLQHAKDALRSVQRDHHEQHKRWTELESICKYKFLSSSGLNAVPSTPSGRRTLRSASKRSSVSPSERHSLMSSTLHLKSTKVAATSSLVPAHPSTESLDKLGSLRDPTREKSKSFEEGHLKKSADSLPSFSEYASRSKPPESGHVITRSTSDTNVPDVIARPDSHVRQEDSPPPYRACSSLDGHRDSDVTDAEKHVDAAAAALEPEANHCSTFPRKKKSPNPSKRPALSQTRWSPAQFQGAASPVNINNNKRAKEPLAADDDTLQAIATKKSTSSQSLPDLLGASPPPKTKSGENVSEAGDLVKARRLTAEPSDTTLSKKHKRSFVGLFKMKKKLK